MHVMQIHLFNMFYWVLRFSLSLIQSNKEKREQYLNFYLMPIPENVIVLKSQTVEHSGGYWMATCKQHKKTHGPCEVTQDSN